MSYVFYLVPYVQVSVDRYSWVKLAELVYLR